MKTFIIGLLMISWKVSNGETRGAFYGIAQQAIGDEQLKGKSIYQLVKDDIITASDLFASVSGFRGFWKHACFLVETESCSNLIKALFVQIWNPNYRRSLDFYQRVVNTIKGETPSVSPDKSKSDAVPALKLSPNLQELFGTPLQEAKTPDSQEMLGESTIISGDVEENSPLDFTEVASDSEILATDAADPSSISADPVAIEENLLTGSTEPLSASEISETAAADSPEMPTDPVATAEVVVCDPNSTAHQERMEKSLLSRPFMGTEDPRFFTRPHDYRKHLNAELLKNGKPLLGEKFFELSSAGQEWRGENPSVAPDVDGDKEFPQNCHYTLDSEEERKWFCAINELWPHQIERNEPFATFIFGRYEGLGRRYDLISEDERKLLKNIVLQVRTLREELGGLDDIPADSNMDQEARKNSLINGLAVIENMVMGHENACHIRLQEILRTVAETIDLMQKPSTEVNGAKGVSTNFFEETSKCILTTHRKKAIEGVFNINDGLFFKKEHKAHNPYRPKGNNEEVVDFQSEIKNKNALRTNRDFELRCAARTAMLDAWAIPEAKQAPSNDLGGSLIGLFQFKDFISPFLEKLTQESLAETASEEFRRMSPETLDYAWKNYSKLNISFKEYCSLLGLQEDDVRNQIVSNREMMQAENGLQNDGDIRREAAEIGFDDPEVMEFAKRAGIRTLLQDPEALTEILVKHSDIREKLIKLALGMPAFREKIFQQNPAAAKSVIEKAFEDENSRKKIQEKFPKMADLSQISDEDILKILGDKEVVFVIFSSKEILENFYNTALADVEISRQVVEMSMKQLSAPNFRSLSGDLIAYPDIVATAESIGRKNSTVINFAAERGIMTNADVRKHAAAVGILDDEENGHFDALMHWCTGNGSESMLQIIEHAKWVGSRSGEILPELFCTDRQKPDIMARLFFQKYLMNTGALIDPQTASVLPDDNEIQHNFNEQHISDRSNTEQECIKGIIAPENFVIHPTYIDELYFESQETGSGTCGIHALNHFAGKPLFSVISERYVNMIATLLIEREKFSQCMKDVSVYLAEIKKEYIKRTANNNGTSSNINRLLKGIDNANVLIQEIEQNSEAIQRGEVDISTYQKQAENAIKLIHKLREDMSGPSTIACWLIGGHRYENANVLIQLENTYFNLLDGMESWTLMTAFKNHLGIKPHLEEGIGADIKNPSLPVDIDESKRNFIEAIRENRLPNGADRIIVGSQGHFVCIRQLVNEQWVLLDSYQSVPKPLPDNSLAKYFSDLPSYQAVYCETAEDQEKLEALLPNVSQ